MSVIFWRGDAPAKSQKKRYYLSGNVAIGTDLNMTINGKTVTGSATADTLASLASAAATAWNASDIPEFEEVTASSGVDANDDVYLELLADTAGKPFTATIAGPRPSVVVSTVAQGSPGSNEVESFYFSSDAAGGVFYITWDLGSGDEESDLISFGASAATVKAAIVSGMPSISASDITVTGSGTQADPYVLTLGGSLASTAVSELTVNVDSISGGGAVTVVTLRNGSAGASDAVYRVQTTPTGLGNTFRIIFGTGATSYLSPTSSASQVQTALEAVASIGSGNVLVYGKAYDSENAMFAVRFQGDLAGGGAPPAPVVEYSSGAQEPSFLVFQSPNQSAQHEVYQLLNTATSGTFTITQGANTTSAIDFDATADAVEAAMTAASITGFHVYGVPTSWVIRSTATSSVTDLSVTDTLTGGSSTLTKILDAGPPGAVNERQSVYTNATTGTFTLTKPSGSTTGPISASASAGELQAALEDVYGAGAVSVGSGSGTSADPWIVDFIGANAGTDMDQMTGDASNLTGISTATVSTTTDGAAATGEVWHVYLDGATGGTYQLSFKDKKTSNLAYNANAATVQAALEALASVGSGNMTVSGSGSSGSPFVITCTSALAGVNEDEIEGIDDNLTGTSPITVTAETIQASTGPHHADEPLNYSGGALPTNGDTLVFSDGDSSCQYGLSALSGVTLASLNIYASYSGDIGLPERDEDGDYYQYRDKYFQVSATTVTVGAGEGSSSGRIKLDLGSVQTTVHVLNTGQPVEQGPKALMLKGTHSSNVLNVTKGSVDVAREDGSTSTFATVRVSYETNSSGDSDVRLGAGTTLTTVLQFGGTLAIQSDTTSLTVRDGVCYLLDGAHTAVVATGGLVDWRTTDEITDLSASNCTVDLSHDPQPKDFNSSNTIQLYSGATLNDPLGTLPSSVKVKDNTGGVTINLPPGKTYTVT